MNEVQRAVLFVVVVLFVDDVHVNVWWRVGLLDAGGRHQRRWEDELRRIFEAHDGAHGEKRRRENALQRRSFFFRFFFTLPRYGTVWFGVICIHGITTNLADEGAKKQNRSVFCCVVLCCTSKNNITTHKRGSAFFPAEEINTYTNLNRVSKYIYTSTVYRSSARIFDSNQKNFARKDVFFFFSELRGGLRGMVKQANSNSILPHRPFEAFV